MLKRLTSGLIVAVCLIATALVTMGQVQPSMRLLFQDEGVSQGRAGVVDVTGSGGSVSISGNKATINISGGGSGGHTIQDEGSGLTARTNLNFVGAGVTCADDAGNDQTDCTIPGGGGNHDLLSATHSDTSADSVVRGDFIVGNSTPAWSRLALGSIYTAPVSNGTDPAYRPIRFLCGFTSGFTTSSTSYVDVTGMTCALKDNQIYDFECYGTFATTDNAAGATNGLGISLNGTGGTGQAAVYTLWLQTTARNTSGNNTTSTIPFAIRNENTFNSMTALASVVQTGSLVFIIKGFYYSGTSGTSTLAVRVRSENAAPQTASIQVGSSCSFSKQE